MSSLVKIYSGATGSPKYGDYQWEADVSTRTTRDLRGVEIVIPYALDKDSNPTVELKAGKTYTLLAGTLTPSSYHVIFDVHPTLFDVCTYVGKPTIMAPGEKLTLKAVVTARKDFLLASLQYTARLYMLD